MNYLWYGVNVFTWTCEIEWGKGVEWGSEIERTLADPKEVGEVTTPPHFPLVLEKLKEKINKKKGKWKEKNKKRKYSIFCLISV